MIFTNYILFILLFIGGGLDSMVKDYLEAKLTGYEDIEYEIVSYPRTLDKGSVSVSINEEKDLRITRGFGYVPVMLTDSRNFTTSSYITVKLRLYNYVMVANRDIKTGEELDYSDFSFKLEDVASLKSDPLTDANMLLESRARLNIRSGEILAASMIERKPLVKRGSEITAYVENGSVIVSVGAIARQDGVLGEVIRVKTDHDNLLKAVVESKDRVKIVE